MSDLHKHTTISISTGTMFRAILLGLGVFLAWYLRDLVLIIMTAIVIASFVESAVNRMGRLRIGRVLGVVIIYAISLSFLAGMFYLFAPILITEVYNFSSFLSSYFPDINFLDYFNNQAFSGAKDIVNTLSTNFSIDALLATSKAFITNLSGGLFQTLSAAFGSFFNVGMIIIISFYLSIQENGIESFLRIVIPQKNEDYAVDLWQRVRRKIALWIKGQMLLGLLVAVLIYLVLSLLGIQYALLLAILTGFMELVPYGMIVAMVPALSFGYLSGGFSNMLMVLGAYLIIHQFEVYLFTPLIVKRVTGLSPLVVILAVLVGYELGGIWGIVLAVPVAVAIMEFTNDIEKEKVFSREKNETK